MRKFFKIIYWEDEKICSDILMGDYAEVLDLFNTQHPDAMILDMQKGIR